MVSSKILGVAVLRMPPHTPKTSFPTMIVGMLKTSEISTESTLTVLTMSMVFLRPIGIIKPPRVHPRAKPNCDAKLIMVFQSYVSLSVHSNLAAKRLAV